MVAMAKKHGVFRRFVDYWRFFPILSDFHSKLAKIHEVIFLPPKLEEPFLPTRFDFFMQWLNHFIANGAFLFFIGVLFFNIPARLEYLFGLGVLRFVAIDFSNAILWKPLERLIKSAGQAFRKR